MTDPAAPTTEAGQRFARHVLSATGNHCEADILAIEAEAELDVERLETALDEPGIYELWKFTEWGNDDLKGSVKAFARIIAAEYARLRSPESD